MSDNNGKFAKELQETLERLPALMGELMREFIAHKDLNKRVEIRYRMKALLDLVFVDTVWPSNPAVKKADGPNPARDAAMDSGMAPVPNVGGVGIFAPAAVQAVPGAREESDNTV